MNPIAKLLGIIIPVFVSSAFCLSVPFIILLADTAVLTATLLLYFAERRRARATSLVPSRHIVKAV